MSDEQVMRDRRGVFWTVLGVTLLRIPLALSFSAVLLLGEERGQWSMTALLFCFVMLILIEGTDLLDGFLARRLKSVTEWGAMMDPYADSIARLIVYWSLAGAELALPQVFLVMALRDVTVGYCRITLTKHGASVAANWGGKIKAIVQGGASSILLMGPLYWKADGVLAVPILSWVVMVVTAMSVIPYAKSAIKAAVGRTE